MCAVTGEADFVLLPVLRQLPHCGALLAVGQEIALHALVILDRDAAIDGHAIIGEGEQAELALAEMVGPHQPSIMTEDRPLLLQNPAIALFNEVATLEYHLVQAAAGEIEPGILHD